VARTRDEAARRRVLDSARDLVRELGPRAVTVDEIAAAAGVGKQTIYRWWPSKSSVIMDALIELTDPLPDDLPESTYEAVRLQMRRVAKMFGSRNGDLIRELVADAQGDPALARDFRDRFFAHRRVRGAATLERGIAAGELRSDLDVGAALDVLYAPLWLRLLVAHRPVTEAAADQVLDLAWPGLQNKPAGASPDRVAPGSRPLPEPSPPGVLLHDQATGVGGPGGGAG
jgi:AcrR family transcriptional regulator